MTEEPRAAEEAPTPPAAPEQTLGVLVTSLARRTPDGVLVAALVAGLAGAVAVALAAPGWWRAIPPLILLAAFGAWGITDRERGATGARGVGITLVRGIVALASAVAVGALILTVLGPAIGRWVS